jgi:hypothetical protein
MTMLWISNDDLIDYTTKNLKFKLEKMEAGQDGTMTVDNHYLPRKLMSKSEQKRAWRQRSILPWGTWSTSQEWNWKDKTRKLENYFEKCGNTLALKNETATKRKCFNNKMWLKYRGEDLLSRWKSKSARGVARRLSASSRKSCAGPNGGAQW